MRRTLFPYRGILKIMKTDILHRGPFTLRNIDISSFNGVSIDSRHIPQGHIFCALKGEHSDGHLYVFTALKNGAKAALVSREYALTAPPEEPLIIVDETYKGLRDMAALYAGTFSMPVIAITGSAGKTSTRRLLSHVLRPYMRVAETLKNYNNHIGLPLSILQMTGDEDIAILEMGTSGPGEIRDLCEIVQPHYGLITIIANAHIGGFGSIKNVQKAKYELFNAVDREGTLFINQDDPRIAAYPQDARKRVLYALENTADITLKIQSVDSRGRYILSADGTSIHLQSIGKGSAMNATAVYAIARTLGLEKNDIIEQIETFQVTAGRGKIEHWHDITIIDDTYNANPLSVKNAIGALKAMRSSGRKIMVFADMLEMGVEAQSSHEDIACAVADSDISHLLCYGRDSIYTVDKARKLAVPSAQHFQNKNEVAESLLSIIKSGDIVLFKGSRGMAVEDIISLIKDV